MGQAVRPDLDPGQHLAAGRQPEVLPKAALRREGLQEPPRLLQAHRRPDLDLRPARPWPPAAEVRRAAWEVVDLE